MVPTTSLLNPDPDQPFFGIPTPSTNVHTTAVSAAAYALDTIRLNSHWELTGGRALGPLQRELQPIGGAGRRVQKGG